MIKIQVAKVVEWCVQLWWSIFCQHFRYEYQDEMFPSVRVSLFEFDECHPPETGTGMKCSRCKKHNV